MPKYRLLCVKAIYFVVMYEYIMNPCKPMFSGRSANDSFVRFKTKLIKLVARVVVCKTQSTRERANMYM